MLFIKVINAATFVGYKFGGFFGAFCATLGVVVPSFTVIALLSSVISRFQDNKVVQYAFYGIRAGVLALIGLGASFVARRKEAKK